MNQPLTILWGVPQPFSDGGGVAVERRGNGYFLDWDRADQQLFKISKCGSTYRVWKHECGARITVRESCNCRGCVRCDRKRAAKLRDKYAPAVELFSKPTLLTFTVPNVMTVEELPGAIENLVKGFERLRRRKFWPKCPGIWALEIVWSLEKGFHPHLHCIVDFPWFPDLQELARQWTDMTGAKAQPDVRRAYTAKAKAGLMMEGLKYALKGWEFDGLEGDAGREPKRAILAVLAGRRAVNTFGGLEIPEDDEVSGASELVCPGCGVCFNSHDVGPNKPWQIYSMSADEFEAARTGPLWADVYESWKGKGPDPAARDAPSG